MDIYYVALWDFELEDSGNVVKDGLVFSSRKAAEAHADGALLSSLDSEFTTRLKPQWSRRLNAGGYIVGEASVVEIEAPNAEAAFTGALAGKGKLLDE